jgi:Carboxypeptidase regulatory-like domain
VAGSISGLIVDRNGAAVVAAKVKLEREGEPSPQEAITDEDGRFVLRGVFPGKFVLTIRAEGFATQTFSGILRSGENYSVPQLTLALATNVTEVHVELSQIELAQEQMRDEEKQRLIGIFPNFYVTYVPNAAPLTSKQKYNLAWKQIVDPVSFLVTGGVAGLQQARNDFSGYGQGAQGYAKRYGASYTDLVIGTYLGSAVLPSLLKQDPRYFYKGTGSVRSRVYYAIANSVICKGDNGHWQFNYSAIGGSLAAGAISNLYYPTTDRSGAALTFENTLIGIGETAAANILQEFVFKKLTTHTPPSNSNLNQSVP